MSHNPSILLVAEATGGVARHVIDLYKGLRSRGWRVGMVLSPLRLEARYSDELAQLDQADITYIPMHRAPHATDLSAIFKIAKILRKTPGGTILHAHSTKAGMIGSRLHRWPRASVFTPHAYRGVDPTASRFLKTLLKAAEQNFSRHYDRILAVAPGEIEYAKSIGIKENVLRCIPNGLDVSDVCFSELRQQRRRLRAPSRLGFVGRLVYQKNPMLFIKVLAEVVRRNHDARAIIVGDGPMKGNMLRLAEHLKVVERIEWRGDVGAAQFMPQMDVLVHTSVYEGLPYSLLEACANLLPVVATSNYGSEAIFRARLPNVIASSADPVELASILLSMFENDALRFSQMETLEEIIKDYSIDAMVSGIEAEYYSLVSN